MKYLTILLTLIWTITTSFAAQDPASLQQSHQRDKALIQAAYDGDMRAVQGAISKGANVNATGPKSRTAMLWAAANGHAEIVEYLHSRDADIDKGDSNGQTPLIFAVRGSHVEIARFLLDNGARIDVQTKKQGITPLIAAAAAGNVDVVELLLERGADRQIAQWNGWTALDRAKQFEHPEVIALLGGELTEENDT